MSKATAILTLGVLVTVVSFSGIPGSFKTIIIAISGIAIAFIGFLLRRESGDVQIEGERRTEVYVENGAKKNLSGAVSTPVEPSAHGKREEKI